jgi:hypothetical protein
VFEREDWTLFRSLNTLGQKAGVSAAKIPQLVAKELADNALDASGDCRVGIEKSNRLWVEDDGQGIPGDDQAIATLFSIDRPLTSSKALRRPVRGALGNGLRVVVGAVLSTGGSLEVSTRGRTLALAPQEDGRTVASRVGPWEKEGTRIVVRFGSSLPIGSDSLVWAHQAIELARGESSYLGKSSAHWYDSDAFFELLHSAGRLTVRDLIRELEGCAEPKAGKIANPFKGRFARSLDRAESERLLTAARANSRPVPTRRLGRCGRGLFPGGYAAWGGRLTLGSKASKIKAELPVSVEVWAEIRSFPQASLFVNRTPMTGKLTVWEEKANLRVYGCGLHINAPMGRRPVHLRINVDIPYMPITTDGKEPDLGPFGGTVASTAAKAIRVARRTSPTATDGQKSQKRVMYELMKSGAAKASGNGKFRFSQRQLLYAIRPDFMKQKGHEPEWKYFTAVLTAYENQYGDIPMLYRDPRGIIYHPHLGQEIPLGTLYVEDYKRPSWLFNKVLYCEKEGFFSILRGINWPEKNDCALMTSKGFSSRAARDLIDLIADTDEECTFSCIHDADAAGTMIQQTLQEATQARGARKVQIINLGLEPEEGRTMKLQIEDVRTKKKKKKDGEMEKLAVARYVPEFDQDWLQFKRIELNAMTTPQFIKWLDAKFASYQGKLVPPADVLKERLQEDLDAKLRDRITQDILDEADIDGRVEEAMAKRAEAIAAAEASLADEVEDDLRRHREHPWTNPVATIAEELSRKAEDD